MDWQISRDQLEIGLSAAPSAYERIYGAFKANSGPACAALMRLTWGALYQPDEPAKFPARLLSSKPPPQFVFPLDRSARAQTIAELVRLLDPFLTGRSMDLVGWFQEKLPAALPDSKFQQRWQQADLEQLENFFVLGPKRNGELHQVFGLTDALTQPEQLTDLLAVYRHISRPAKQGKEAADLLR